MNMREVRRCNSGEKRKNGSYCLIGVAWVTGTGGPCANTER